MKKRLKVQTACAVGVLVLIATGLHFRPRATSSEEVFLRHMSRAHELMNEYDHPLFGPTYVMGKCVTEAACEYQLALAIKPTSAEAMDGLGTCYFNMAYYFSGASERELVDDGEFFLKKSMDRIGDPLQRASDYRNIVYAEMLVGHTADAKRAAEKAVKLDPELANNIYDGKKLREWWKEYRQ